MVEKIIKNEKKSEINGFYASFAFTLAIGIADTCFQAISQNNRNHDLFNSNTDNLNNITHYWFVGWGAFVSMSLSGQEILERRYIQRVYINSKTLLNNLSLTVMPKIRENYIVKIAKERMHLAKSYRD